MASIFDQSKKKRKRKKTRCLFHERDGSQLTFAMQRIPEVENFNEVQFLKEAGERERETEWRERERERERERDVRLLARPGWNTADSCWTHRGPF